MKEREDLSVSKFTIFKFYSNREQIVYIAVIAIEFITFPSLFNRCNRLYFSNRHLYILNYLITWFFIFYFSMDGILSGHIRQRHCLNYSALPDVEK